MLSLLPPVRKGYFRGVGWTLKSVPSLMFCIACHTFPSIFKFLLSYLILENRVGAILPIL